MRALSIDGNSGLFQRGSAIRFSWYT